jgi:hypothetical protein
MTRPRKRPATDPHSVDAASPGTTPPPAHAHDAHDAHADPAVASRADRELASDLLVQLVGTWVRDTTDLEAPEHARYLEWLAAEAHAALEPAERAALVQDAEAFARRMMAELAKPEVADGKRA